METVARIFESCREDRLPASRAGRVAVAQEAGAACTEVSESRARRIPFSVEMFPPKGQLTLDAARKVVEGLRAASPDFISVTCSAGGSGNGHGGHRRTYSERGGYTRCRAFHLRERHGIIGGDGSGSPARGRG
ncbi:MAG: hypothetical protein ACLUVF_06800 [Adlercreutzia sp.]